MKKILSLITAGILCISMTACSNSNAFKVGDTEFSKDAVEKTKAVVVATSNYMNEAYLTKLQEEKGEEYEAYLNDMIVSYMIDNEVVYAKAQADKITVADDEVNQKFEQVKTALEANANYKKILDEAGVSEDFLKESVKKDLVIAKYKNSFEEGITVADAEIQAYYNEHIKDFEVETVEASHILVSNLDIDNNKVDESKMADLKAKADSLLEKAKAGEDFATLAKENSDDQSTGKNGGTLGVFTREDKNPEFSKVVFSLNAGDISDVFETNNGYEIVKVTNKSTTTLSLDKAKDKIISKILADKYLEHINSLRGEAEIERF